MKPHDIDALFALAKGRVDDEQRLVEEHAANPEIECHVPSSELTLARGVLALVEERNRYPSVAAERDAALERLATVERSDLSVRVERDIACRERDELKAALSRACQERNTAVDQLDLALGAAEALQNQRDAAREQLAAMTKARDEACLLCKRWMTGDTDCSRIAELLTVGNEK